MQLPEEDRYSHNREYLLARIAVLMGGRIAEELFMDQMTTGASNDFEQATDIAQKMVSRWGMSDSLGTRVYGDNQSEVFLGRDVTTHQNLSDAVVEQVDKEVSRIIDEEYARARKIIEDNRDIVEVMAKALMEFETLEADQIDDIMAGKNPSSPSSEFDDSSSSSDRNKNSGGRKKRRKGVVKPRMDSPASGEA